MAGRACKSRIEGRTHGRTGQNEAVVSTPLFQGYLTSPIYRGEPLLIVRPFLWSAGGPAQSMIWSARDKSVGGRVSPSAFAAFKLTNSSNFVGWYIGMSPGFAPLRI
jgi:hypothetical protein